MAADLRWIYSAPTADLAEAELDAFEEKWAGKYASIAPAYHRFALSTADVEDLLAERGVIVCRETIRKWVNRFGFHFANCIKRDRPLAADKWHLYEVVIPINGRKYWLWRAVDANGDMLDILVQPQRNAKRPRDAS